MCILCGLKLIFCTLSIQISMNPVVKDALSMWKVILSKSKKHDYKYLLLNCNTTLTPHSLGMFFATSACCENICLSNLITQSEDLDVSVKVIILNHIILRLCCLLFGLWTVDICRSVLVKSTFPQTYFAGKKNANKSAFKSGFLNVFYFLSMRAA